MPRQYPYASRARPTKPSVHPWPEDDNAWTRLPSVLRFCGMGHTKFYELIKLKLMPRPNKLCGKSYWRVGEIREAVRKLEVGLPVANHSPRGRNNKEVN